MKNKNNKIFLGIILITLLVGILLGVLFTNYKWINALKDKEIGEVCITYDMWHGYFQTIVYCDETYGNCYDKAKAWWGTPEHYSSQLNFSVANASWFG